MWTDLPTVWRACLSEAWAAYCAGSLPIGAAIVDADGRIVSQDRNRIVDPDGAGHAVHNHELAHAELNALLALRPATWDKTGPNNPRTWTLYTTMEPCPLCLGAFYMSGLRQLHYAARDSYAGSVNLIGASPYLSVKPVRVTGPHPLLEPLCVALCVETNLRETTGDRTQRLLNYWRATMPQCVILCERLFELQTLPALRAANAPAAEMVAQVSAVWAQVAAES